MKNILRNNIFLSCVVLVLVFFDKIYVLSKNNFFEFDDYTWLHSVIFKVEPFMNWAIFPTSKFQSRPIGAHSIELLYYIFGFNYQGFHLILLLLHLLNVLLLILILTRITHEKKLVFLSALIFGIWPTSTFAVQWISAIFDLLTVLFSLLAIYTYLIYTVSNKNKKIVFFIFSILSYYFALRSKEMALALPCCVLLFEIYYNFKLKKKLYQLSPLLSFLIVIMILYGLRLISLGSGITVDPTNPYYQQFKFSVLANNIFNYFTLYFNLENPGFNFMFNRGVLIYMIFLLLIILLIIIYKVFIKKNYIHLLLFIAFFILLLPVLPMKNMQMRLYLYLPSIPMAIFISILINEFGVKVKKSKILYYILIIILLLGLNFTKGNIIFTKFWLQVGERNRISWEDLSKIQTENPSINSLSIVNVEDQTSIFYYGPAYINNIMWKNNKFVTYFSNESENSNTKVFEYQNNSGSIILTSDKSILVMPKIEKVMVVEYEKGKYAVSIIGNGFLENSVIMINNNHLVTIYGNNTWLTGQLSEKLLGTKVNVVVVNNNNISSNVMKIGLNVNEL